MTPIFSSSNVISEKVVREGLYGEYEVDLTQQYDDARSTYKSAKETKSKKGTLISRDSGSLTCHALTTHRGMILYITGKYTAILAILIVGSFIVPMAQYWWYVKDDNTVTDFFNQSSPPPKAPEKPQKKGWF